MKTYERWLTFALGILIGGAIVWIADYNATYPILQELISKCGEPCL